MILVLNIMIDDDGDPGVAQDAVRDQEGGGQRDLGLHGLHRGAGGHTTYLSILVHHHII